MGSQGNIHLAAPHAYLHLRRDVRCHRADWRLCICLAALVLCAAAELLSATVCADVRRRVVQRDAPGYLQIALRLGPKNRATASDERRRRSREDAGAEPQDNPARSLGDSHSIRWPAALRQSAAELRGCAAERFSERCHLRRQEVTPPAPPPRCWGARRLSLSAFFFGARGR